MKMNSEKKLKIPDMILVSLTAVILLVVVRLVILQPTNHKLVLVIVGLLALVLIALSTYRYGARIPSEQTGTKAPLFVPKALGLGWSVNSIGMSLTIATVILVVFGVALFK